jgi:hypothetical protein
MRAKQCLQAYEGLIRAQASEATGLNTPSASKEEISQGEASRKARTRKLPKDIVIRDGEQPKAYGSYPVIRRP